MSDVASAGELQVVGGAGDYSDMELTWICLCVAGGGPIAQRSSVQNLSGVCRAGEAVLTPAGRGGSGRYPSGTVFAAGLAQGTVAEIADSVTGRFFPTEALASRIHRLPILTVGMRALRAEAHAGQLSSALVEAYLGAGFAELARSVQPSRSSIGTAQPLPPAKLRRARELIEKRFRGDLSITELAAAVSLSRFHFTRSFQAATGMAPHAFVQTRRMEEAAQLLSRTDHTITNIAASIGFESPSAFATLFRRHYGASPTEFRRMSA